MRAFLFYVENHLETLVFGFLAIVFCYTFARLIGARVRIALCFAAIPILVGWAYRTNSFGPVLAAMG